MAQTMTAGQTAGHAGGQAHAAPGIRLMGWTILALMLAFLVNNVANIGYGSPTLAAALTGGADGGAMIPILIYAICLGSGIAYVLGTTQVVLRQDSDRLHRFNLYLIRGCFWSVLLVGIADATIAQLRVENLLIRFMSADMAGALGRSAYVGPHIHMPLVALGFVIALFTRTLGFTWLTLMIVAAQLLIVFLRFVFSYEQALMGDLVRYWYAALFLFASAYTLFDEGHVRVDVFYAGFSRRKRGIVNAVGSILLGVSTCALILALGLNGKTAIINAPVASFEITQTGAVGMFVKYQMAAFLAVFSITMIIQFVSYFFGAVADIRDEPGHQDHKPVTH
jgi:TRAP-type mannitol/chloroaromatic compound transport system permease small subunit